jgi:hypothetical protein
MSVDATMFARPFVLDVLKHCMDYEWSLQGFGMLRAYVTKELRLHVWDSRYKVDNVTMVHDHPWDFVSYVASGKIVNTMYVVHPYKVTDEQAWRLRKPFLKAQIVCGTGGGNDPATLRSRGEKVWLMPLSPETYVEGYTYKQAASEVHHTSYDDGTVTLVRRKFLPDTEHAHVFFNADEDWVSAEPRAATPDEVSSICAKALVSWRAS